MKVMAATRDASWFAKPGQAEVYHIVTKDLMLSCRSGFPATKETLTTASEISKDMRCQRSGCRNRWPK